MIYLDNAATTMHKPQAVIDAVTQAMCSLGNAGRGGGRGQRRRGRPHRGHHGPGLRLLLQGVDGVHIGGGKQNAFFARQLVGHHLTALLGQEIAGESLVVVVGVGAGDKEIDKLKISCDGLKI